MIGRGPAAGFGPLAPAAPPRRRAIVWAAILTGISAAAGALLPGRAEIVVTVWAILLGVIALAYVAAVTLREIPLVTVPRRDLDLALLRRFGRRARTREVVPGLAEMERMVLFGHASAYDFETRLLPHLLGIAEQRVERHGLTLRSQPEQVRALVGDDVWALVRPDRQPIGDRHRRGLPAATLQRVVEALDAL